MKPFLLCFVFGPRRAVAVAAAFCALTLPAPAASEDVGDYYVGWLKYIQTDLTKHLNLAAIDI